MGNQRKANGYFCYGVIFQYTLHPRSTDTWEYTIKVRCLCLSERGSVFTIIGCSGPSQELSGSQVGPSGAGPNKLAEREVKTTAGGGSYSREKKNTVGGSMGMRRTITCFAPEPLVCILQKLIFKYQTKHNHIKN